MLGQEHQLQFFHLLGQLIYSVCLHFEHLVFDSQLLFRMLFRDLLDFNLSLQLCNLASKCSVLLLQVEDLLLQFLHLVLLSRQVVLLELLLGFLEHQLSKILLLKVLLRVLLCQVSWPLPPRRLYRLF